MASSLRGGMRRRKQDGVELGAEAADRLHHRLVAADEPVVAQHRGNGNCQAVMNINCVTA